jgi:CO/xanthine dehydrogenase FAD-binding subunit
VAAAADVNGSFSAARLVVGGATARPVVVEAVSEMLVGQAAEEGAITAAADAVRGSLDSPIGDTYASGEYRVQLAVVMAKRALTEAVERARG